MLKAILVDDEPMILRGLEKLIDWKKIGVEIVGTGGDGLEALALIDRYDPDLAISDINMPNFSGIDLLKKLKAENKKTKLIFISGYQEFEYARDALKYGATDYLIKPINEKQLIAAIQKIVDEKNINKQQPITLELHLDEQDGPLGLDEDIMISQKQFLGSEGYYSVLCCKLDESASFSQDECEIIHFSMRNIIEDLLGDDEGYWVISKNNAIYVLVYKDSLQDVEHLIGSLPGQMIQLIEEGTGQGVSISTSKIVDDLSAIRVAFKTANERMEEGYFYGKKAILSNQGHHQNKYSLENHYKAQVAILDCIHVFDHDRIHKTVGHYMDIVKDVSLWDKRSAINYCLATLVFIQQHLSDGTIALEKREFDQIRIDFENTYYYEQAIDLMVNLCEAYMQEIASYAKSHQNEEINKVKAYIQVHYAEQIKLETLAELVYMNPNYFSGYFKKHAGMKFKEYITSYRINEAEKLMLSTNYKVYEIAEAVGFGDYRHFSEVFKKAKGLSPSEYRKRLMDIDV